MKAIVGTSFGPADQLRFQEVDDPVPQPGRLIIRVRAASVNAGDWHIVRGQPYLARPLMGGLRGPKQTIRGWDAAGVVESVGAGVDDFAAGDEVFGSGDGTFAELASIPAHKLAPKPGSMTFEEAAAIPVAGVTALQALRDRAAVTPGQRVLLNGAAGGVGTFSLQVAKALGAEVTAVCSARNAALAAELGADRVVDYGAEDFTRMPERYDVVVDNVGNRSLRALRRALAPNGTLVVVGGGRGRLMGSLPRVAGAVVLDRFTSQHLLPFLARPGRQDLLDLLELVSAGRLRSVVDRVYPLREAAEAIRYVEEGHAPAKVVVVP